MNVKGAADNTPTHMLAALGHWRILKLCLDQPDCQVNCMVRGRDRISAVLESNCVVCVCV